MVLYHPVFRAGESHGLSILLCEVHNAHLYAHDALLDVGKSFQQPCSYFCSMCRANLSYMHARAAILRMSQAKLL